jgi:hypothetical protein
MVTERGQASIQFGDEIPEGKHAVIGLGQDRQTVQVSAFCGSRHIYILMLHGYTVFWGRGFERLRRRLWVDIMASVDRLHW